jgi:hypothetical protein
MIKPNTPEYHEYFKKKRELKNTLLFLKHKKNNPNWTPYKKLENIKFK